MKKSILIGLLACMGLSVEAQTRKILITEAIVCYEDSAHTSRAVLIPHGDSVIVTKSQNDDWVAEYYGKTYYINESDLKPIHEENLLLIAKKNKSDSIFKRKRLIAKYGFKMGSFISNGYIKVGMTKKQAIEAWGEPNEIHKTVFANRVTEQWVYSSSFLYFKNGILDAWQN